MKYLMEIIQILLESQFEKDGKEKSVWIIHKEI